MERVFVEWLRTTSGSHRAVSIGIGDDAAVLDLFSRNGVVVTTDLLADGTHFVLGETAPQLIGRKCLAANLSDLAAMAAKPRAAFVSLLLPRDKAPGDLARRLVEGMRPLAAEFGVAIAGGDTNVWSGGLAVSITALGECDERGPLTRSGARPGDLLLVTGELGGSIEGHHLSFTPRVDEALLLRERYELHAGMDITDGLAIDLARLCEASSVGAELNAEAIPTSPAAAILAMAEGNTPMDHALGDGEDFELLIAAPPDAARAVVADDALPCGVAIIGRVVHEGLWMVDARGQREALTPRGYEHR